MLLRVARKCRGGWHNEPPRRIVRGEYSAPSENAARNGGQELRERARCPAELRHRGRLMDNRAVGMIPQLAPYDGPIALEDKRMVDHLAQACVAYPGIEQR
jgi:hypothetical protein